MVEKQMILHEISPIFQPLQNLLSCLLVRKWLRGATDALRVNVQEYVVVFEKGPNSRQGQTFAAHVCRRNIANHKLGSAFHEVLRHLGGSRPSQEAMKDVACCVHSAKVQFDNLILDNAQSMLIAKDVIKHVNHLFENFNVFCAFPTCHGACLFERQQIHDVHKRD